MRILQITPYFLPHNGGIERYVFNLSKALVNRGHEVEIVTSNIPHTYKVEVIEGIKIRREISIAEPLRNPIIPAFLFPRKKDITGFDIIHVHMIYSSAAIYGVFLKKIYGTPVILTHHGRMKFEQKSWDACVRFYEKTVFRKILSTGDWCVALSEMDTKFLQSFDIMTNISTIPNGINPSELRNDSKSDLTMFLNKQNLQDKKIILFVGRLISVKGLPYLLDAFFGVKQKCGDSSVILVIVGNGEQHDQLVEIAKNHNLVESIRFLGDLPFSDTIKLYQSSKMFVLPSLSEGFPTTVLEAMYYGIPVISTDIPVVKQYFSDSVVLVPTKNSEALEKAILTLLNSSDLTSQLSIKSKDKVINNYTWETIVNQYLEIYLSVLSKKQSL